MIDIRLRSKVSEGELEQKRGKILTDDDYNLLLTGRCRVRQPDGRLLCVYLPGVLEKAAAEHYDQLRRIKSKTDNRGLAAGAVRVKAGSTRTRGKPVLSAILGAFDPLPSAPYCRLTAFTAKEGERFESLRPYFQAMGEQFAEHVPDRFENQMGYVRRTAPDWVVPGTPFTTITVNNSYPTGVHTDKGDLDDGFSCLGVLRRGKFSGGQLTFPEYRVSVDLQEGDMLLMDAHQWHGNTRMACACGAELDGPCAECGAERISVVAYYRTELTKCETMVEEDAKRHEMKQAKNERLVSPEEADEAAAKELTTT